MELVAQVIDLAYSSYGLAAVEEEDEIGEESHSAATSTAPAKTNSIAVLRVLRAFEAVLRTIHTPTDKHAKQRQARTHQLLMRMAKLPVGDWRQKLRWVQKVRGGIQCVTERGIGLILILIHCRNWGLKWSLSPTTKTMIQMSRNLHQKQTRARQNPKTRPILHRINHSCLRIKMVILCFIIIIRRHLYRTLHITRILNLLSKAITLFQQRFQQNPPSRFSPRHLYKNRRRYSRTCMLLDLFAFDILLYPARRANSSPI